MPNFGNIQWDRLWASTLEILAPGYGFPRQFFWMGWILYVVFFLLLIALFMQSDKQLNATMLLAFGLLLVAIAKTDVMDRRSLPLLLVNAAIFAIPMIVAGLSKARRSMPVLVLAGILAAVYFFVVWFFLQRGG